MSSVARKVLLAFVGGTGAALEAESRAAGVILPGDEVTLVELSNGEAFDFATGHGGPFEIVLLDNAPATCSKGGVHALLRNVLRIYSRTTIAAARRGSRKNPGHGSITVGFLTELRYLNAKDANTYFTGKQDSGIADDPLDLCKINFRNNFVEYISFKAARGSNYHLTDCTRFPSLVHFLLIEPQTDVSFRASTLEPSQNSLVTLFIASTITIGNKCLNFRTPKVVYINAPRIIDERRALDGWEKESASFIFNLAIMEDFVFYVREEQRRKFLLHFHHPINARLNRWLMFNVGVFPEANVPRSDSRAVALGNKLKEKLDKEDDPSSCGGCFSLCC